MIKHHIEQFSDSNGKFGTTSVSSVEIGYLAGTSNYIQSQLNSQAHQLTTYRNRESDTCIEHLIDGAPNILNTLGELSAALNDYANFASTIQNQISTTQDIIDNVPGFC